MLGKVGRWLLVVSLVLLVTVIALLDSGVVDVNELVAIEPTVTPTPRNRMCDCILTQIPTPTPHPFSQ